MTFCRTLMWADAEAIKRKNFIRPSFMNVNKMVQVGYKSFMFFGLFQMRVQHLRQQADNVSHVSNNSFRP
jgi:hypothetical protein